MRRIDEYLRYKEVREVGAHLTTSAFVLEMQQR